MSRMLIDRYAAHSLLERARAAGEDRQAPELACAALAGLCFELRSHPGDYDEDEAQLGAVLRMVRSLDPTAMRYEAYVRESVEFTMAEIEAFLHSRAGRRLNGCR